MVNLTQFFRDQFLKNLSEVERPGNKWVIVILDKTARRLFDYFGEDDDILQYNVKAIERLENPRPSSTSDLAVYFIMPTEENVLAVLKDFQPTSASTKRKYHAAHLFFLAAIPDKLFSKLTDRSAKYWLTLKELNINYYPFESRVFSLERPGAFETLFSTEDAKAEEFKIIASQLKSVCLSLGGNPVIRYQACEPIDKLTKGPAKTLAFTLQDQLDKYMKENPEFGAPPDIEVEHESMEEGNMFSQVAPPRPTFLILDRAADLCAPLLHELTYQALVNDVLTLANGRHYYHKFVNGFGETKNETVVLDEKDPLWNELRHSHIAEVTEKLLERFKSLASENAAAANLLQKKDNEVPTVSQMRDVVAAIPELQTQVARYSTHIELARLATDEVGSSVDYPMAKVLEMEQIFATKFDDSGEPVTQPLSSLAPLLNSPNFPPQTKLRLLLLYVIFRDNKVSSSELNRLANHAGLGDNEINAFERFRILLKRFHKEVPKPTSGYFTSFFQSEPVEASAPEEESIYAFSRYIPQFKKLLLDAALQVLPDTSFPFTVPEDHEVLSSSQKSLRIARPTWQKKQRRTEVSNTDADFDETSYKGRLIVFMVGGITYSEMRWVYDVARKCQRDVLVGSTHILTPEKFLHQLQGQIVVIPEIEEPSTSPPLSCNSSTASLVLDEVPLVRSSSEGSTPPESLSPYGSTPSNRSTSSLPIEARSSNRNSLPSGGSLPSRRLSSSRSPQRRSAYFTAQSSKLKHSSFVPGDKPPKLPPRPVENR